MNQRPHPYQRSTAQRHANQPFHWSCYSVNHRHLEQAFDRLNPDYGISADPHNPHGHQALRDREAALALGTRVAVACSRENDPNPVVWLAGQDYRAADATRTARLEPVQSRRGPERLGPER